MESMQSIKGILLIAAVILFIVASWLNNSKVAYAGLACFAASQLPI